ENGVGRVWWRNENDRGVGAGSFHRFGDRIKDRTLEMFRTALAGCYATDDVRSVFDHLLSMERALTTGKTLHYDASLVIYEDAHPAPPARPTTFCAPSFMPSAMVKLRPLSRRIFWPCSTLVPSMRMTTGTFSCRSLAAATTPVARTSQRRMPPKMLMK